MSNALMIETKVECLDRCGCYHKQGAVAPKVISPEILKAVVEPAKRPEDREEEQKINNATLERIAAKLSTDKNLTLGDMDF